MQESDDEEITEEQRNNGVAIGDTFTAGGATYKITNLEKKEVELIAVDKKYQGEFEVPQTVESNLSAIKNENIGDYIDLGNNVIGNSNTTDDWKILHA